MARPSLLTIAGLLLLPVQAGAVNAPASAQGDVAIAPIVVVAASPLGGGVDIDRTPGATQALSADDLVRGGSPNAAGALSEQLASVTISDNLDDAFQPDILLRGFAASPVLGTPQGLAVYQSGVRINEAFGETVNWDLIPDIAIRRIEVLGANPVFGLNALGGAVAVSMKTGFTSPGGDASISGGSFGRRDAVAESGVNNGAVAAYVATRGLDEDGWRRNSPSRLRELYGDLAVRAGPLTGDLAVTVADNRLDGESAAPVQELAVSRDLVFTSPQQVTDRLIFVTLNGAWAATPTLSLQGAVYYRGFRQNVINGDTTGYGACAAPPDAGFLCQADGLTPLTDAAGGRLPDISGSGTRPLGQIDRERIRSRGLGGSAQITVTAPVLRRENHLAAGVSLDQGLTHFDSTAEVGVIDAGLQVVPSGLVVTTPQNTPFTASPVALRALSSYLGLYATDTFNLTPSLAITASGRFNSSVIALADGVGRNLDGRSVYQRFNPALGATWRSGSGLTAFAGYSEGSRVPNASEIECSNPLIPCLLPSSLASDPPTLRQVVSRTAEVGLRGHARLASGALTWNAGAFRTDVTDDIYAVATALSAGYFQNISGTRRQGVELAARYAGGRIAAFASYSYVEATFRSDFALPSPSNPFRDAAGDIHVRQGDRLPGVPRHRLKVGADYEIRPGWRLGGGLAWVGDQIYRGDESNQMAPLGAYAVLNLHASAQITPRLTLFANVDNVADGRYATFGVLGDPTGIGAAGVPAGPAGVDTRFQSPAAPIAAYGGLRLRF